MLRSISAESIRIASARRGVWSPQIAALKQRIIGTTRPVLREFLSTNRGTRVRGLLEARLHADSLPDL